MVQATIDVVRAICSDFDMEGAPRRPMVFQPPKLAFAIAAVAVSKMTYLLSCGERNVPTSIVRMLQHSPSDTEAALRLYARYSRGNRHLYNRNSDIVRDAVGENVYLPCNDSDAAQTAGPPLNGVCWAAILDALFRGKPYFLDANRRRCLCQYASAVHLCNAPLRDKIEMLGYIFIVVHSLHAVTDHLDNSELWGGHNLDQLLYRAHVPRVHNGPQEWLGAEW